MDEIISIVYELLTSVILFVIVMNYVLTSKALYALAKKYKIRCPGYAWVPVASARILGSVADSVENSENPRDRWGKTMFSISMSALCVILFMLVVFVLAILKARHVLFIAEVSFVFFMFVCFMLFVFFVLMLARMTVATVCTYKIFEYAYKENSIGYLLVSFMLPLAKAVCLNKCKNKICKVNDTEIFDEQPETVVGSEETDTNFEELNK